MSSTLSVRPRREEDLDACVAVLHRVHENEGYPRGTNDFRKFLSNDSVQSAWVAEVDGHVVGHVAVNKPSETDLSVSVWKEKNPDGDSDGSIAVLARLFVLPESRKGGTAKALVEAATAASAKEDVRLLLFVLVANQAAIRLYDRLRWERFGTSLFRYGDGKELEMEAICFASPSSV